MKPIPYLDRLSKKIALEKVYGGKAVAYLYSGTVFANFLRNIVCKNNFISSLLGRWHKASWTKKNILPFIKEYGVDSDEFLLPPHEFTSFNDFFIRKLKKQARPIETADAIIPADARYWFYEKVDSSTDFLIKGEHLNLENLLGSKEKASIFSGGSAAIARLCPSDYHRFHFPIDCMPSDTQLINGPLFSVNPLAIKQNIAHLTENKRKITYLESPLFKTTAFIEIGATSVGTIQETYTPFKYALKGDEKGYFEFGGSALILLFEPNTIAFCPDLTQATKDGYEIRCLFGQKMGLVKIV